MKNEIDNGGKADVSGRRTEFLFERAIRVFVHYAVPWIGGNGVCHAGNDFLPRFISPCCCFCPTKRTVHLSNACTTRLPNYNGHDIYRLVCLVFWRYSGGGHDACAYLIKIIYPWPIPYHPCCNRNSVESFEEESCTFRAF